MEEQIAITNAAESGFMTGDYLLVVLAYLLGSIPFGLVVSQIAGKGDIRKIGSGNIGATNVLRTGSKKLAFLTLLLDALKGVIAVILAKIFSEFHLVVLLCAIFSVLGHIFPVWLKFKGGKGVATTIAVLVSLFPLAGITVAAIWLIVFYFTRVSSLSAILSMTSAPVVAFFFVEQTGFGLVYTTLFLSIIVVIRHSSNIRRLVVGQEKPMNWKK